MVKINPITDIYLLNLRKFLDAVVPMLSMYLYHGISFLATDLKHFVNSHKQHIMYYFYAIHRMHVMAVYV